MITKLIKGPYNDLEPFTGYYQLRERWTHPIYMKVQCFLVSFLSSKVCRLFTMSILIKEERIVKFLV